MTAPSYQTGDIPTASEATKWFVNANYAVKTAIQTVSASTTLVDDNHLSLTVDGNATYTVTLNLLVTGTGAPTGDLKFAWSVPTNATFVGSAWAYLVTTTGDDNSSLANTGRFVSFNETTIGNTGAVATALPCVVIGQLTTASGSGTFKLQWAQVSASGTTTLGVGSYLDLKRVA